MNGKTNKTDRILAPLLTGDDATDDRLRRAFELGCRHGQASDRESIKRAAQTDQVTRLLITLMRSQGIDLEQAMSIFELPKGEREMYRRIIGGRKPKQRMK